ADNKVHIHGEVSAGSFLGSAKDELQKVISSPPIEQHTGIIRIGKSMNGLRNTSIAYTIEVPRETELSVSAASGSQEIQNVRGPVTVVGANNDVKASSASGGIKVAGNPSGNSYWHLKTASGSVEVSVPKDAGFHLSAEAVSGEIRADIPIVIEDQDKHSLRAHVGTPGGRVEVRTVSGGIRVQPTS